MRGEKWKASGTFTVLQREFWPCRLSIRIPGSSRFLRSHFDNSWLSKISIYYCSQVLSWAGWVVLQGLAGLTDVSAITYAWAGGLDWPWLGSLMWMGVSWWEARLVARPQLRQLGSPPCHLLGLERTVVAGFWEWDWEGRRSYQFPVRTQTMWKTAKVTAVPTAGRKRPQACPTASCRGSESPGRPQHTAGSNLFVTDRRRDAARSASGACTCLSQCWALLLAHAGWGTACTPSCCRWGPHSLLVGADTLAG